MSVAHTGPLTSTGTPRQAAIDAACREISAAAGDLNRVAAVLVEHVADLTGAARASMFEMRGAHWAMVASAGDGSVAAPLSLSLSLDQIPVGALLIGSTQEDDHPLALLARPAGVACLGAVPIHLWPSGRALVSLHSRSPGGLNWEDMTTAALLALAAGAAAYASPPGRDGQRNAIDELGWHQELLEGIARGTPTRETVKRVCLEVESRFPGTRCSVLIADREQGRLRHVAAPSLPPEFMVVIDGLAIGDGVGACGTAAATLQPAVVADTLIDPRTASFVELASAHDLRSVWSYPLIDAKGRIAGTFALYRDHVHEPDAEEIATVASMASVAALAIERAHNEAALRRAASQDPLTGLPNRRSFTALLARALERCRRRSTKCAVIFMDLDGFKLINDALGHDAGDRVLVEVAKRLSAVLGSRHTVARFGGDEFTVLIDDATPADTERAADHIAKALIEPFHVDSGVFVITAAVGIAMTDGVGVEPGSVIRDADAAMYAAKGKGRGQRSVFDQAVRAEVVARMHLERELHLAVETGAIAVHFQPVIDIGTGRWCSTEALARWRHPQLGDVAPDRFICLAEEIGLVADLGRHVLIRALEQVKRWSDAGLALSVAVNVSPTQLADPGVTEEILKAVAASGVDPGLLCLEITESALMDSPDEARSILSKLRSAGIPSVIDDFGTGYSSIGRLSDLPVAGLKIDKSFVARLADDEAAVTVVRAVIQLAHSFSLSVVAEGVETRQQLEILRGLDCDCAQGFLFAAPTDAARATAVLSGPPPVPL